MTTMTPDSAERFLTIPATLDFEEANEELYRLGVTDGLPVVPPTPDRVARMLDGLRRDPAESLGALGPAYGQATIEKIAVNAVMAGCRPEYLPVLAAAVEAMVEYEFNLYGINATTHPVTPMLVINGPAAERLRVNSGYNCMGQGWRANATIGRAIRLILVNIAGGTPGKGDRATHGTPAKFSFCLAENELASPWLPLHVRRGFAPDMSTVTVHGSESPHEINNHTSEDGEGILRTFADTISTIGHNNSYLGRGEVAICIGPEHAQTIARDGPGIQDIQDYLFRNAGNRRSELLAIARDNFDAMAPFDRSEEDPFVPLVEKPEDYLLFVAGGVGKHSMAMPSFGLTRSVTKAIDLG
ncbi:hypothetical protein FHS51_002147 [Sphingobium wenxiniae]|uniref:Uncharacterized protein n=1 Tax=Sphingobium wenxiniae (strain DSM 21828 / CGMCC 1.7748 / JZ-1) TaxID=595605 RepID=A0A562KMP7_SPHWJ|nr:MULTISPECIES: hypothetical protein [Sphingobium]MBB6191915.1 hypothetical protein [Sphingobium wenxiniae]TWH96660.1 hypothetical protein IQ35_00591 [Sphingobium wenxiniae]WRD75521.1 hypothetical protein QQ987_12010 [Sphingobium baderi]